MCKKRKKTISPCIVLMHKTTKNGESRLHLFFSSSLNSSFHTDLPASASVPFYKATWAH